MVALFGSLVLQGCSSSPAEDESPATAPTTESASATPESTPSEEPTPTEAESTVAAGEIDVAPATGEEVNGTGYSFNALAGWETQPNDIVPGFSPDVLVMGETDENDFTENINVLVVPAEPTDSPEYEAAAIKGLEATGATDIVAQDRIAVAGTEAVYLTSAGKQGPIEYLSNQFILSKGDKTYAMTITFGTSVSDSDRDEAAKSVLATWTWQ